MFLLLPDLRELGGDRHQKSHLHLLKEIRLSLLFSPIYVVMKRDACMYVRGVVVVWLAAVWEWGRGCATEADTQVSR